MVRDPGDCPPEALAWVEDRIGAEVRGVREIRGGWTSRLLVLTPADGRPEVVLRLITNEPWRTHGAELSVREHVTQRLLGETAVPAPRTIAVDAAGECCGHPAHLMTLLPGVPRPGAVHRTALDRLAECLATVHDVVATIPVRTYQSWAWEAKYVVPAWARDAGLWEEAFALLRTEPPAYEPCFIHRDFQHGNVLWVDGRVTGVVDWVEASTGPAWLDVAHCSTNIAIRHGSTPADVFADAYVQRTGREPQPYYDVMDVVGFLPPPGRESRLGAEQLALLEARLAAVLYRVS